MAGNRQLSPDAPDVGCHGWASGVLAFFIEYVIGLNLSDGGEHYKVHPHTMGIKDVYAKIPTEKGWLEIIICDDNVDVQEIN